MVGRKVALLIGNGSFDSQSGFTDLRCPAKDVEGLSKLLAEERHGAFQVSTLVDRPQRELQLALSEMLRKQAGSDDLVIVYYSGHGAPDEDGNLYLAALDSAKTALDATGLGVDFVLKQIRSSKSQKVALILDCCYSGSVEQSFTKGQVSDQVRKALTATKHTGSGMYTLTASTSTQLAEEKESDEYSLLTKHIVSGIADGFADLDEDGIVTMHELTVYVQRALKSEGCQQEPQGYTHRAGGGEMEFALTGRPAMAEKCAAIESAILQARKKFHLPLPVVRRALGLIEDGRLVLSGTAARTQVQEIHRFIAKPRDFVATLRRLTAAEESAEELELDQKKLGNATTVSELTFQMGVEVEAALWNARTEFHVPLMDLLRMFKMIEESMQGWEPSLIQLQQLRRAIGSPPDFVGKVHEFSAHVEKSAHSALEHSHADIKALSPSHREQSQTEQGNTEDSAAVGASEIKSSPFRQERGLEPSVTERAIQVPIANDLQRKTVGEKDAPGRHKEHRQTSEKEDIPDLRDECYKESAHNSLRAKPSLLAKVNTKHTGEASRIVYITLASDGHYTVARQNKKPLKAFDLSSAIDAILVMAIPDRSNVVHFVLGGFEARQANGLLRSVHQRNPDFKVSTNMS